MALDDEDLTRIERAVWAAERRRLTADDPRPMAKRLIWGAEYSQRGWQVARANEAAIAELAGQVAGLAELVRAGMATPGGPLTPEQLEQLVDRVEAAARAPGERLAAALAAAGAELVELDDDDPEPA